MEPNPHAASAALRIAVASQNRRTVTGHAGRCRRFRVYDAASRAPIGDIELSPEQVLHGHTLDAAHPLAQVQVLIAAGIGDGLARRLERAGITSYSSAADDPACAVADYLDGRPPAVFPNAGGTCDHSDENGARGHAHRQAHSSIKEQ